jgi:hypothetical protein
MLEVFSGEDPTPLALRLSVRIEMLYNDIGDLTPEAVHTRLLEFLLELELLLDSVGFGRGWDLLIITL